jgi:hypothetical protein
MPLHDWSKDGPWDAMHLMWIAELARDVKSRLPGDYRAYAGPGLSVAIGTDAGRPDISVRTHFQGTDPNTHEQLPAVSGSKPDVEVVAMPSLDPLPSLFIERDGRLVAVLELISPRNKDRPVSRTNYTMRYAAYLADGVNLMLVDVHRLPSGFSFLDGIEREMELAPTASIMPPLAATYRVGEQAAEGGRFLAIWRRQLAIGDKLPTLPLPLTPTESLEIDLEKTYASAASDVYLT